MPRHGIGAIDTWQGEVVSANPSSSVGTPANPANPAASTNLAIRFAGLDACRGLIMVGMSLDHCVYLLWTGAREPSFLFWYGPFVSDETLPELVIRLIANLCAPGFFLLMGAGLTLFAAARRQQGWTEAAIGRHIAVRGTVLVALQFCVENPLWTLKPDENWMNYVGVLYALGVSMALTGILNRLAWAPLALLAGSLMVLPEVVIPFFQNRSEQLPLLVALLVLPGKGGGLVVYFAPWMDRRFGHGEVWSQLGVSRRKCRPDSTVLAAALMGERALSAPAEAMVCAG